MIYITIPVHNRKDLLRGCLESLRRQTDQRFQVIVTDDGSTDGTAEMLENDFPDVWVEKGDGQLWWSASINKAITRALHHCERQDYILALNDDLIVPENYIENFHKLSKKYPDTLIGSVVTDIENRDVIHSGGVRINWHTARIRGVNDGKKLSDFRNGHIEDVSFLTGRGVLIPSEVFRKVGLYNNEHYVQCGDTELPIRARKAGYRLIVSYAVPVYSYVSDDNNVSYHSKYTLSDIKKYYFDIRSHMNLKYRYWFAMDSTNNVFHGLWFFACDFVRITGHFFKRFSFKI